MPETLRDAIERTFAATAESASDTTDRTQARVQGLLDEVARRGQEASADLTQRVVDAAADLRPARGEDLRHLEDRLARIERRLGDLEERAPAARKSSGRATAKRAPAKRKSAPRKGAPRKGTARKGTARKPASRGRSQRSAGRGQKKR